MGNNRICMTNLVGLIFHVYIMFAVWMKNKQAKQINNIFISSNYGAILEMEAHTNYPYIFALVFAVLVNCLVTERRLRKRYVKTE